MTKLIPAVVIQVLVGVILGNAGILEATPLAVRIGEAGLVLMLFMMGLETDLRGLLSRGRDAAAVAVLGVVFSGALGFSAAFLLGWSTSAAVVTGGVLCATSIAISASVLGKSGLLARPEGQIVLAAAVLDDVLGLVILAVVSGSPTGTFDQGLAGLVLRSGVMVAVVVAAVSLVNHLVSAKPTRRGGMVVLLLGTAACISGAVAAEAVGLAPFIGAFLAGAFLQSRAAASMVVIKRISAVSAPLYFILVGAMVDLGSLASVSVVLSAVGLLLAGLLAKVMSGVGSARSLDRVLVGLAMVPRGEVGLIFAGSGLAAGLVTPAVYAPLVGSVLLTTILGPILLRRRILSSHPAPLRALTPF